MVSIIVPVYNTEKYIRRCLNSIVGQTYQDIEIILVDDGSVDSSGQICDEYAVKDPRVQVVHQQNQGAVGARKTGIERCSGDYIMFVDSDDIVKSDMCFKLINKAIELKVDLVVCDFAQIRSSITKQKRCGDIVSSDRLLHKIIRYQYPSVLWNKLFKRELAIISLRNCVVGDDISEDFLANVSCMLSSPTIAYVQECLYFQNRDVENSLTINFQTLGKALYAGRKNIERVYNLLINSGDFEQYKYDFFKLVLNVKTYLLKEGKIEEARNFYPEAHKEISAYSALANPVRWIYYAALNWGRLGMICFKSYLFLRSSLKH